MTPYQFPAGKDPAFLFGCGRFRMEPRLLENCAEEILRLGRHPLFVCDDNSHAVVFDKVAASLAAAGVGLRELRHNGFCCRDDALAFAEAGALEGVDVVLGCGGGVAPASAPDFAAERCGDQRDMRVTWTAVDGAEGYTVRFGVNPDELHTHWQVIGGTEAVIRCLTKGVRYYVTVDAYNDSGVTAGKEIRTV